MAAVTAGLVMGTGAPRDLRAEDRMTEQSVLRTLELLLEGSVFLVMGLELFGLLEDLRATRGDLSTALWIALLTGALVVVVRAAFVASSLLLLHRRSTRIAGGRDRLAQMEERLDTPDHAAEWAERARAARGGAGRTPRPEDPARVQRRTDQLLTIVARRYRMDNRRLKRLLVEALELWPRILGQVRKEVTAADLVAAHAGILG